MQLKELPIYRVKAEMIVAQDLYDSNSSLLIPKNTPLTRNMITKLKLHDIKKVQVYNQLTESHNTNKVIDNDQTMEMSHICRMRESEEFKSFNKAFTHSVQEFKSMINDIVAKNQELDIDRLSSELDLLLAQSNTSFHIFDMLHCMRTYDDLTYVHSLNVALICDVMGKWLGFSKEEQRLLSLCGLLHDMGKMMIPIEIIAKPSRLTKVEFEIIKSHPNRGYNILKDEKLDQHIKNVALMHHEKCDGTGYPNGLVGDQIDDYAKIVAIADVYDAMTANRVYRKGMCPFRVIEIFELEGLQKYDPKFLLPFLEHTVGFYINNRVRLSNQMIGHIVMINKAKLSRPVVCASNQFIDLSTIQNLKIEQIL